MKPFACIALISFLALPAHAHALAHAVAERVPKLDVESSCRDAKAYGMTDPEQTYKNCMLDENEAKKQLQEKWSHYKASTRRDCIEAGANPSPSYVELLTCIEMTEEILTPASGGGGGGASVGKVPAGALGSPAPRPQLSPGPRAMPR